jgi:galactokinase
MPPQLHQPPRDLPEQFAQRFGRPCTVLARAPGRVNLIGEHTDYNDGFVLPMALERNTWVAGAPRRDGQVRVYARELDSSALWTIGAWRDAGQPDWTAYVAGVADKLTTADGRRPGYDLLIASDVPVGGGLSSSAALEVATAQAVSHLAGQPLAGRALADLCRAVEHEYACVPCGIMDQYVSVLAQAEHAFLLDCRARTWEHIPLALGEHVMLIINSGVRHKLAAGEYAQRQQQCQEAVACFRRLDARVTALRDVTPDQVAAHAAQLGPIVAARARHVTTENQRTVAAGSALRHGDLPTLGRLMNGSHESLRDDYQVSCRELDLLVEIARSVPGVLGARMTGGGFGGCIVALVPRAAVPIIEAAVRTRYDAAGYGPAHALLSQAGPGAALATC